MTLSLLIYFADVLADLSGLVSITTVITLVILIISTFIYVTSSNSDREENGFGDEVKKIIKISLCTLIALCISVVVLPSKQTYYLMLAGYTAQTVYEKTTESPLIGKMYKIIQQKLDNELDSMINEGLKKNDIPNKENSK